MLTSPFSGTQTAPSRSTTTATAARSINRAASGSVGPRRRKDAHLDVLEHLASAVEQRHGAHRDHTDCRGISSFMYFLIVVPVSGSSASRAVWCGCLLGGCRVQLSGPCPQTVLMSEGVAVACGRLAIHFGASIRLLGVEAAAR